MKTLIQNSVSRKLEIVNKNVILNTINYFIWALDDEAFAFVVEDVGIMYL